MFWLHGLWRDGTGQGRIFRLLLKYASKMTLMVTLTWTRGDVEAIAAQISLEDRKNMMAFRRNMGEKEWRQG